MQVYIDVSVMEWSLTFHGLQVCTEGATRCRQSLSLLVLVVTS